MLSKSRVARRSREPVEARQQKNVVEAKVVKRAAKLRKVTLGSARRLAKNLLGSGVA